MCGISGTSVSINQIPGSQVVNDIMTTVPSTLPQSAIARPAKAKQNLLDWRGMLDSAVVPVAALMLTCVIFSVFVLAVGHNPLEVWSLLYQGAFSNAFSWQNTLQRAAPLILTGLAVALPAQVGLVLIGSEGALVLGALAAAMTVQLFGGAAGFAVQTAMLLAGVAVGGAWASISGWLKSARNVNETISSLLLSYIGIALFNHLVEGPLRDPESLNKPSTKPIGDANAIGNIPGLDVHWGLVIGIVVAIAAYIFIRKTTGGFAARVVGGNQRTAQMVGIPVGKWMVTMCGLGGAAAGLAGAIEVGAVHGAAHAGIIAGYGNAGILIAFIARQNALAVVPVAILFGGINAAGGLLQRRLDMPDATVLVLQGIAFVCILALETLNNRKFFSRHAQD
jgi:simple sugar transport system permease protein